MYIATPINFLNLLNENRRKEKRMYNKISFIYIKNVFSKQHYSFQRYIQDHMLNVLKWISIGEKGNESEKWSIKKDEIEAGLLL